MNAWIALIAFIGIIAIAGAIFNAVSLQSSSQVTIVLIVIAAVSLVIAALLGYAAAKAQLAKVKTGTEALIGATGVAVTDLKPKGEIRINGEFWEAISKTTPIASGQTVEVVDLEGMALLVKPWKEKA
ncbi:MAG TPA: NfeD family protein [Candidatus Nanoarchaeia archaeon]|nr:NfeD family protein [Candidatus Nanoarchaeia archaeon]